MMLIPWKLNLLSLYELSECKSKTKSENKEKEDYGYRQKVIYRCLDSKKKI